MPTPLIVTTGSPPHVWGNHQRRKPLVALQRFTPTRVGKSSLPAQIASKATVHPHTCGEILCWVWNYRCHYGSPPHVWGNRIAVCRKQCPWRFTPTRVGKSRYKALDPTLTSVHPHTCGEIVAYSYAYDNTYGSPPHVWGNLYFVRPCLSIFRFTPTRVGKSG